MSSSSPPELSLAIRESTLLRFEKHRQAWESNPALRQCYARWYGMIAKALPSRVLGEWVEVGSGPGLAAKFIPEMVLTDIVQAPWHARRAAAEALPYGDGELGALVLFDVLHHVAAPVAFFAEAVRVLKPGGRILLVEPYISLVSGLIYRHFHPELVDMSVDPLVPAPAAGQEKDPFHSNQALPTLIFCRHHARRFRAMFPQLAVTRVERFSGLSYPATGGLSRRPFLPLPLWRALFAFENILPAFVFRLLGFRVFVTIERR